ncbi:MAG: Gfo/Idh/MocA family oxidoreductase [Verrucomicrobiota bacterium]
MRAGFVGTGYFASEHAGNLKRLGVDVSACYGVDREQVEAFASGYGAKVFDSALEMIDPQHIDVLYIVVPPFAHDGEIELAAIGKGIPFLCEKPVGLDVDKCREIAARIEGKGLVTSSGYWLKAGETAQKVKKLISENEISFVQAFWHSIFVPAPWWGKMETSGGPLTEMVTHYVDYMREMIGEIDSVCAISKHGINAARPNADIYDAITSMIRFKGGQIGALGSSHLLALGTEESKRVLELAGRDFHMCVETDTVKYKCGTEDWVELEFEADRIELNDKRFLEAVGKNDPSLVYGSYADAVKTLEATVAITASAEEKNGEWVSVG